MLGQVSDLIIFNTGNKQTSVGDLISLTDALIKCPEKLPYKFELRINESWLESLNTQQYAMALSVITDIDMIVPLLVYIVIKEFDVEHQQHVYKFIKKSDFIL